MGLASYPSRRVYSNRAAIIIIYVCMYVLPGLHCVKLSPYLNGEVLINLIGASQIETLDVFNSFNAEVEEDSKQIDLHYSSSWESDVSGEEEKRKKLSKKKRKKRKKKHKEITNEKTLIEKKEVIKKPDTIWLENTTLHIKDAYRTDVRPDKNNIEYSGLYKMDIAYFFEPIQWKCLGLGKHQSVSLYDNKKKRKRSKNNNIVSARYFSKYDKHDIDVDDTERKFSNHVESHDFIPLYKQNNKTEETVNNSLTNTYLGTAYLERNKTFTRKLFENPNDIQTWLQFVDYQDELNEDEEKTFQSPKAIIEKKIGILDKAIFNNITSTELHIKRMHLVKVVSPSDKVHQDWKELLVKFPNKYILWHEYLLFVQSDMLLMTVPKVMLVFQKCFRMLLGIYRGTIRTHKPEDDALQELLVIFIHMVVFLWKAGKKLYYLRKNKLSILLCKY